MRILLLVLLASCGPVAQQVPKETKFQLNSVELCKDKPCVSIDAEIPEGSTASAATAKAVLKLAIAKSKLPADE